MWSVSKVFFILSAISCIFLLGVSAVIIARSAKSWKEKFQEYKYRKSLYPKQKEKSKASNLPLFAVLASVIVIAAISAPRINASVCIVGSAAAFFLLHDEILGGGFTCSSNFRNKISDHRCCRLHFKQDDGRLLMFDDQIAVGNAFIASIPCSFFIMLVSALTHFFTIDSVAFGIAFAFYCACMVISLSYFLKINDSSCRLRASLFFILHVAGILFFVITTVRLPIALVTDPDTYSKAGEIYTNIFVLLLVTSIGLLSCIDCLFYKNVVSLSYPVIPEDEDNHLEVKLKNGTFFNSTDKFFYPVKFKNGIKLLFADNSSAVIAEKDIDSFTIHGFGETGKDQKTIVL